ncbi:hemerythrin domain-containing protein [Marivita sp. S0852]|uniref:hemerythrin domain-containing protein n=1 Tax=Marivita sp. S0852 TaxID=3373893 RepID=UPI003981DDD7
MNDPSVHDGAVQPTDNLVAHLLEHYHAGHRRELPQLVALARKVEANHAHDINAPHGLTQALERMKADLEHHMHTDETIVFPALHTGWVGQLRETLEALRDDRDAHLETMNRIAAIVHGFRLPFDACRTWTELYERLGTFAEDLDEHLYLEGQLLFSKPLPES